MRLKGRDSRSRLEEWDWKEEILDLVSRVEKGLSLCSAVAPLCLPPPGQHRGQVLHGSDRGVQRAPGPPVSWKDSDLKIQGRNPNEQKEWTWRSTGPKGEVQVSEVGSRSGNVNLACIQQSHNTISQTKHSHNLWFHSMSASNRLRPPRTLLYCIFMCSLWPFLASLHRIYFVLLHCIVLTLYCFIASYLSCFVALSSYVSRSMLYC